MSKDSDLPTRRDADFPAEYRYADDEISLYDLWIVLLRRFWWIVGVTLLCLVGGVVYWQSQEVTERYLTTFEIGSIVEIDVTGDIQLELVEPRSAVVTRLRESVWPALRQEVSQESGTPLEDVPSVRFRSPGSDDPGAFVFLETDTSPDDHELVERLHRQLYDATLEAHRDIAGPARRLFETRLGALERALDEARRELAYELRGKLAEAQVAVEDLQQERDRLRAAGKRLEGEQKLLEIQFEFMQGWVQDVRSRPGSAGESGGDSALIGLLTGSAAESARADLLEIERRLQVELPDRLASLEESLRDTGRKLAAAQEAVGELEFRMDVLNREGDADADHATQPDFEQPETASLRVELDRLEATRARRVASAQEEIDRLLATGERMQPTRAMGVAVRADTGGRGGALILALSLVLGGMLGVFAAFLVEFHSNALRRMRQQREEG